MPQDNEKGGIDLSKILLPKKDSPSKDSAQRVNAGALFEAERSATLTPTTPTAAPAAAPTPAPAPKPEPGIKPLETYQSDIENLVQSKNVSVLSIAAAEAARRGEVVGQPAATQASSFDIGTLMRRAGMVLGGILLLAAAGGALWWVLKQPTSVQVQAVQAAPFIKVDEAKVLAVPATRFTHSDFMKALTAQRDAVSLSLGLIEYLELATASATSSGQTYAPLTTAALLTNLSPNIPDALVRALSPSQYLLGVHAYDDNQPFLILGVDSYEGAYAGMLAWERTMQSDLEPLFNRIPPVRIQEPVVATTTATSTAATSTPAAPLAATSTASTTPSVAAAAPSPAEFADRIVENHDARVIEDENGEIVLLWTFINRSVLVITTNEATLREIISRLTTPAVVPTP